MCTGGQGILVCVWFADALRSMQVRLACVIAHFNYCIRRKYLHGIQHSHAAHCNAPYAYPVIAIIVIMVLVLFRQVGQR